MINNDCKDEGTRGFVSEGKSKGKMLLHFITSSQRDQKVIPAPEQTTLRSINAMSLNEVRHNLGKMMEIWIN